MTQFSQSRSAAWIQNLVSRRREASGLYAEITGTLPLAGVERVLDIGTGTGLQLRAIHQFYPAVELFGIDLSAAAVHAASRAIAELSPDLRVGSIEKTTYPDNFFDVVTCHSSLSYWDRPLACLNEIYRILKPGGIAKLFEPHREIDLEGALHQIRVNLAGESPLRRWAAVQLNKFALQSGNRVGLNLYSRDELIDLALRSSFGESSEVAPVSLLKIPIFVCIQLWKTSP
jgi:SAM-dependent methyltransferase